MLLRDLPELCPVGGVRLLVAWVDLESWRGVERYACCWERLLLLRWGVMLGRDWLRATSIVSLSRRRLLPDDGAAPLLCLP